ncbi:MAG TPA: efflux RND transporter periplasmic adaptor subunit [Anaerolineae bacterium]|nr:efflux RND transporter periplasmic adaptor subunit [Anaerolineae bacterium]HNT05901.1 efflux RND transporter periplasmic adaptor subunit [Anaerolineae bacterium]HOU24030.1 efflux RND transporter periplasmic adaptor subunit [Anaerolineae bacterium]HQJ52179.1 efflux RND transporter periplasmic adaptor subunit [Anaerolineae bacterium]
MANDQYDIDERRSRRVNAIVGGVALLALLLCAVWAYPRAKNLFSPKQQTPGLMVEQTNDVAVTRGPLAEALLLSGTIEPLRTVRLSFQEAAGRVAMVYATPGDVVQQGQLLVELDAAALQRDLAKVRGELLSARNDLDRLVEDRGLSKRIALEEELRKARQTLDDARSELERFKKGKGTPADRLATARAELELARDALVETRDGQAARDALEGQRITADLAEIEHGPYAWITHPSEEDRDREWLLRIVMLNTRETYNQALLRHDMDVRAAEQKVEQARRDVDVLVKEIAAGSAAIELEKHQAAVQQAQARVQQLQDRLRALEEGDVDPDVAKAQAQVVKLQRRAADAEASVKEATIVAPFTGVIGEVTVAPGATVAPGQSLLTLMSAESLRVKAAANEMDIGRLTEGQDVTLTFDAFPGESVPGQLGEIPRYGTYQNGITVFNVPVTFEPGDLQLRVGMSANVAVPLDRKENVLKVPTMAVQRDLEGTFVLVVEKGRANRRAVKTGVSDGIETEIVEGLAEGELVRVVLQSPIRPRWQ